MSLKDIWESIINFDLMIILTPLIIAIKYLFFLFLVLMSIGHTIIFFKKLWNNIVMRWKQVTIFFKSRQSNGEDL